MRPAVEAINRAVHRYQNVAIRAEASWRLYSPSVQGDAAARSAGLGNRCPGISSCSVWLTALILDWQRVGRRSDAIGLPAFELVAAQRGR